VPGLNGQLTQDEKNEIRKKIDDLWRGGSKNCPVCGSNKWFLSDHVVEAPIVSQGVRGFGSAYPAIQLISEPCGYTISFNAVILGVMKTAGFP
jgi:hypothetical protein